MISGDGERGKIKNKKERKWLRWDALCDGLLEYARLSSFPHIYGFKLGDRTSRTYRGKLGGSVE